MSDQRVIKKYPNRRLYDTLESRYVTLADIRELVMHGTEFVVMDSRNNSDITRGVLLQVIAEQEHAGEPVMSRDFLSHVIRSHGDDTYRTIGNYLDQSLRRFVEQKRHGTRMPLAS